MLGGLKAQVLPFLARFTGRPTAVWQKLGRGHKAGLDIKNASSPKYLQAKPRRFSRGIANRSEIGHHALGHGISTMYRVACQGADALVPVDNLFPGNRFALLGD